MTTTMHGISIKQKNDNYKDSETTMTRRVLRNWSICNR